MTREEWLLTGAEELRVLVARRASGLVVPPALLSVGFPKGHRGRQRAIGQCWSGLLSEDGRPHLFVCPSLADPARVLDVLLHELIHAAVGTEAGHKGPFSKVARACGLLAPWTATTAGPELAPELVALAARLGKYEHAALRAPEKTLKPGSRLRLWECMCEPPVKVRVGRDEFDATCGVCGEPFELQAPAAPEGE